MPVRLFLNDALLAEDLDRPIAGAMDPDLRAGHQPVAELEAALRAGIEAEEIADQVAEVPAPEWSREPMRHAERHLVHGQPQRRRQGREIEVRLQRIEPAVGIGALRRRRSRLGQCVRGTAEDQRQQDTRTPDSLRTDLHPGYYRKGGTGVRSPEHEEIKADSYGRGNNLRKTKGPRTTRITLIPAADHADHADCCRGP